MLRFTVDRQLNPIRQILCLGAHSDDIEIGCGGTILRILDEFEDIEVKWIVFSADQARKIEAAQSADKFLAKACKREIKIEEFRDGFFPYIGAQIKEYFEKLKKEVSPDLIFAPCREDLHQDHRMISELAWNTFRDHFILEYEIPKYDGDFGRPNFYVALEKEVCLRKVDIILNTFRSQKSRNWFTADAFLSVMKLRGIEINAMGNYAEAFYGRKVCF